MQFDELDVVLTCDNPLLQVCFSLSLSLSLFVCVSLPYFSPPSIILDSVPLYPHFTPFFSVCLVHGQSVNLKLQLVDSGVSIPVFLSLVGENCFALISQCISLGVYITYWIAFYKLVVNQRFLFSWLDFA